MPSLGRLKALINPLCFSMIFLLFCNLLFLQDYIFIQTDKKAEAHEHAAEEDGHKEEGHKEGKQAATINFERVQIVRGATDLGFTEIQPVSELPANARLIVKGAFFVMAKMTNTGEHEH